jgi:hypothetical protein
MKQPDKEITGLLLLFLLAMAGLQWLLLWLIHWSVALIASELISFVLISYVVALSHASPNGGSNGPGASVFAAPLLFAGSVLLCSLWTLCFLMKKEFPNSVAIVPLCVIAAFVIGRFTYNHIRTIIFWGKNYSICNFQFENQRDNMTRIHGISFKNQTTGFSTDIDPSSNPYPNRYIPRRTDQVTFRYMSSKTNRMVWQDFPFDYALCNEKESFAFDICFWVTKKNIYPIKFILLPDNKIDLYINNRLTKKYLLNN